MIFLQYLHISSKSQLLVLKSTANICLTFSFCRISNFDTFDLTYMLCMNKHINIWFLLAKELFKY